MAFCQGEWQHVAVHEFGDGNVHALPCNYIGWNI